MGSIYLNGAVGGIGDQWCFINASRIFAKSRPADQVFIHTSTPDVVKMWNDSVLTLGLATPFHFINPYLRHRIKHASVDMNYLGTFCHELGMPPALRFDPPPVLKMPFSNPIDEPYIAFQPHANWAVNAPDAFIQSMVDAANRTGMKVIAVGSLETKKTFAGVDYSHLQNSVPALITLVAGASLVIGPRSIAAHVAAAYNRPSLIWVPDDGENWHLDYPGWNRRVCAFSNGVEFALEELKLVVGGM